LNAHQPHAALAAALRERLDVIEDEKSRREPDRHMARLKAASEKITALQERLPQPVHPQLAHYLQRCSYEKALAWLEENPTP
jgi:hypothetical protein